MRARTWPEGVLVLGSIVSGPHSLLSLGDPVCVCVCACVCVSVCLSVCMCVCNCVFERAHGSSCHIEPCDESVQACVRVCTPTGARTGGD